MKGCEWEESEGLVRVYRSLLLEPVHRAYSGIRDFHLCLMVICGKYQFLTVLGQMCFMELVHKDGYRLYRLDDPALPSNSFIMASDAAAGILYRPHIAGKELQDSMKLVAEDFIDAVGEQVLKGKRASQITEVIFLAGRLYYQLNHGFKKKYDLALPQCFLGIKRQRIEGTEGGFTAVATYENFESLPENATVIIGDTVATGATLQKGIYHLLDSFGESGYKLENLVVCSLACSVDGAMLMKEIEQKVKRDFPDANVYLFVAEELFHLMPDGTDLRFLGKDNIMPDETQARVLEKYGEFLGHDMKCAVFDWGTRCKNPIKHYREFLEFAQDMLAKQMDGKSRSVIGKMKKETLEKLEELENEL